MRTEEKLLRRARDETEEKLLRRARDEDRGEASETG